MSAQLLLFDPPPNELQSLKDEVKTLKESQDKVRRGMFARHNELAKMYLELKNEHELLIQNICKGGVSKNCS